LRYLPHRLTIFHKIHAAFAEIHRNKTHGGSMNVKRFVTCLFSVAMIPMSQSALFAAQPAIEPLKVLLIDGQNNHQWQETTPVLTWIYNTSGRFKVTVSTTPAGSPRPPKSPGKDANPIQKAAFELAQKKFQEEKKAIEAASAEAWKTWNPIFSDYDVVVSNYNGESWPEGVQKSFEAYVKNGGGFVTVHAADNSFPDWPAYNEMIGLGGWNGRNEKSGPMMRLRDGVWTRDETPGAGGTHGVQHEFVVETQVADHPIMAGLPMKWKHAADELYAKLRGPATNMTILASAFSALDTKGTNEHEPLLMVIDYGKGRVFHTTLGHGVASMASLGFQVTLLRGTEWAATGQVTQPLPPANALTLDVVALHPPTK
jgi:uncharacterized protein